MAVGDKKISGLNPAGTLDGSEPIAIVKGGETVATTTQDVANLAASENLGTHDLEIADVERVVKLNGNAATDKLIINNGGNDLLTFKGDNKTELGDANNGHKIYFKGASVAPYNAVHFEGGGYANNFIQQYQDQFEISATNYLLLKTGNISRLQCKSSGVFIENGDFHIPSTSEHAITGAGTHVVKLGGALSTDRYEIQNSAGQVATRVSGNNDVSFFNTSSVAYTVFDSTQQKMNTAIVNTGLNGTAVQYSLNVYSRNSQNSGIATFNNHLNTSVIDFRQASGHATIDVRDNAGSSKIFLDGGTGKVTSKLLEVKNTSAGPSEKTVNIIGNTGLPFFKVMSNGKIGVGTTADPTAQFEIATVGALPVILAKNTNTVSNATVEIEHTKTTRSPELRLTNDVGTEFEIRQNSSAYTTFSGQPVLDFSADLAFINGTDELVNIDAGGGHINVIKGDVVIETDTSGIILVDRDDATNYRLYVNLGVLNIEAV